MRHSIPVGNVWRDISVTQMDCVPYYQKNPFKIVSSIEPRESAFNVWKGIT
jgi:hypothetical protein